MSRFDITTCSGDVGTVEQDGDRLYWLSSYQPDGRPGWWYRMQDEGLTWIRGRHVLGTPATNALRVAWELSGVSATHAEWEWDR